MMFDFMTRRSAVPVSAADAKKTVEKCFDYTEQIAKRASKDDLEKINRACHDLNIPVIIEKYSFALRYLYYMRPKKTTDYQKLLQPRARAAFSGSFGTTDVSLYQEGQYIVLDTPGAKNTVLAADILRDDRYYDTKRLRVAIGKTGKNENVYLDLEDAPHVLIGGETGSGKSVLLHQMICSLICNHSADELQLYLIDTKRVEFNKYEPLRNVSVAYSAEDAVQMMQNLCEEMDKRYKVICRAKCRDIDSYNLQAKNPMSRKVVVIDELSDLMSRSTIKKETERCIVRIAQLARACGIHLIIATQRPDRTVVTGLIKDNIPVRICLSVSSGVNSRIILDQMGGERLNAKGDMLFLSPGKQEPIRCQGGKVTEKEINNVVHVAYYHDI